MLDLSNAALRVKFVGPIHLKIYALFKDDSRGIAHIYFSENICQMYKDETSA